ncbi:MAG: hypothetical protein HXS54_02650 [Theionarchaea archaeon]|nr:hypothetical protein [Theionarchaea archaeon]
MKEKKDLLAYCGLYCGDCLGYTGVIADAAETFINVLKTYKFDQTVTHIFPENKGFYACYECTDFETCENLKSLHKGLHYDSCLKNLQAIKEMGLESWIIKGKRFMYWDIDH